MNIINQKLRGLALVAMAVTAFLPQAKATVVSVSPVTQTIGIGNAASVDIIVSGLTQPADAVGGFSLTLGFNGTFLSGTSFLNDPGGTMGALPLDASGGFAAGSLDLFFVADVLETQKSLAGSEGAGFTLATVSFLGTAAGLSPLTLSNVVLSNWDGSATLSGVSTSNGQICVRDPNSTVPCEANAVPEPASMLLVVTALGALALRRRKVA
jgi:hypothetical protein